MSRPADIGRQLSRDEIYHEKETSDGKQPDQTKNNSVSMKTRQYYVNTDNIRGTRGPWISENPSKPLPVNQWVRVTPNYFNPEQYAFDFSYMGSTGRVRYPNIYLAQTPLLPPSRASSPEKLRPEGTSISKRGKAESGDDMFGGRRRRRKTHSKRKSRKTRRRY